MLNAIKDTSVLEILMKLLLLLLIIWTGGGNILEKKYTQMQPTSLSYVIRAVQMDIDIICSKNFYKIGLKKLALESLLLIIRLIVLNTIRLNVAFLLTSIARLSMLF